MPVATSGTVRRLAHKLWMSEVRDARRLGIRHTDDRALMDSLTEEARDLLARPEVRDLPALQQPQAAWQLWLQDT